MWINTVKSSVAASRNRAWFLVVLVPLILTGCQDNGNLHTEEAIAEASDLVSAGQYTEGLEKMRAIVEANPDDPRIQRYYGEALMSSGQPSLAVWPLSRAMRDPDQLVDAGLLLARAQIEVGSGIDAINTATRILETDPTNDAALLLRVRAHLRENLEERALEDIDRAEELGGDVTTLEILRLDALLGLGREREAETLLTKLAKEADQLRAEDPGNAARLCAATATFTSERGQIEAAKSRFEECLEGEGFLYAILFHSAVKFFDQHDEVERSTELYKRRFEHDPERLEARVEYADRLQRVGRASEAESLLLEATEKQKSAWTALADFYAISGDMHKAIQALDEAIEASPEEREDWIFARADFYLSVGETKMAERSLDKIVVPAHRELLLARIATARGELEEASRHFEEGIRLWPDNPDARYLAARNYERLGNWKAAADHLREAARMDPPHYESSIELAELQRALGDSEGVSFLLMRLAEENPGDARVIEKLIEYASDTNSAELGVRMLNVLSGIRGQSGHAIALAASRMEKTEGPEAALRLIAGTGVDLLAPESFEALQARIRLLVKLDRHEDAMETIARALERDEQSSRLRLLRASVFKSRDQLDRAIAEAEEARRIAPTDLEAILDLAEMHAIAGRPDVAMRLYAEAVPIEESQTKRDSPGGKSRAALELARLEHSTGEVDSARKRLRGILAMHPRQGDAAWLLLKCYDQGSGSDDLDDETRRDLALRASVFEGSPEARKYWQALQATNPDA